MSKSTHMPEVLVDIHRDLPKAPRIAGLPGVLVFHPDCGGLLRIREEGDKFHTCERCGTKVSERDRVRIMDTFIRPGKWVPNQAPAQPAPPPPVRKPAPRPWVSPESFQIDRVTPFQRAFFDQLGKIQADSKDGLIELARQQGIPQEAANAYWDLRARNNSRR